MIGRGHGHTILQNQFTGPKGRSENVENESPFHMSCSLRAIMLIASGCFVIASGCFGHDVILSLRFQGILSHTVMGDLLILPVPSLDISGDTP